MNPIDFESKYTVFDFTIIMNRLIDDLNAEAKDREQNDSDRLLKVLRVMKNMLNRFEF